VAWGGGGAILWVTLIGIPLAIIVWGVAGLWSPLIGIPLAFLGWGVAWLWKAYRLLRGFIDLNNNTPVPM